MTSQSDEPASSSGFPPAQASGDDPGDRDIVIVMADDGLVVDELDDDMDTADEDVAVDARQDVGAATARHDNGDAGRGWHDIQAMFVDDPRGSVQLAAAAADAAVDALMATLHQRQSALAPADEGVRDSGETEQLREALRSYRVFCQQVADLGQQLSEPATMAH
jgi:hypothetical protein